MKVVPQSNKTITDFRKKKTLEQLADYQDSEEKTNLFDKLLGGRNTEAPKKPGFSGQRREFTLFTHDNYRETELIPREIEQLKSEIRQEIESLKKVNTAVLSQVVEIEKAHRGRHVCPYCSKNTVRRVAVGIWECSSCSAKFTGKAYTITKKQEPQVIAEAENKPEETSEDYSEEQEA